MNWMQRLFTIQRPASGPAIDPGLLDYRREHDGQVSRLHLRVDPDGSGVLIANAAAGARLTPSGVLMAARLLEGKDDHAITTELREHFSGLGQTVGEDIAAVRALINELIEPDRGRYPLLNLTATERASAPLQAEVTTGDPASLVQGIDRLWREGVPFLTLRHSGQPKWLVRGVERAEDLGMITSVRATATQLVEGTLLDDLAAAGVDCLVVPWVGAEPALHDELLGQGDHDAAKRVFEAAHAHECCAIAEIPVLGHTFDELDELPQTLGSQGVRTYGFYAVVDEDHEHAVSKLQLDPLQTAVQELGERPDSQSLWLPPIDRDEVDLGQVVRRGPSWAAAVVMWFAFALVGLGASPDAAAQYRFAIPTMEMRVELNPDASADVEYEIVFANEGQTIDIIDVGMPYRNYNIPSMRANLDGIGGSIYRSEYIDQAVEVHVGSGIPRGQSGTFGLTFHQKDMVYQDTTSSDLASFRITPTWYGGEFVRGLTDIKVLITLPAGVNPDEVLHQGIAQFSHKAQKGDQAIVMFSFDGVRDTGPHMVGISFPKRVMDRVVTKSIFDLLVDWFIANPQVQMLWGGLVGLFLSIAFFRFSNFTGITVWLILIAAVVAAFVYLPPEVLVLLPLPALAALGLNEWFLKRRRTDYLPPIAQVEGGGIKRGLTAVEAAILLEQPLSRVLMLVIYGLLNKGIVDAVKQDPLWLKVVEPYDNQSGKVRRKIAADQGVSMHEWENAFVDAIEAGRGLAVSEADFGDAMKSLIDRVVDRVVAFDLSDTVEYYEAIVARALTEASAIGEVEQATAEQQRVMDRNLDWLLLDDASHDLFVRHHWYRPRWHHRCYGTSMPGLPTSVGSRPMSGAPSASLKDVAASFAGWTENAAGDIAGALSPLSLESAGVVQSGAILDLSGVDKVTGEIIEALADSSSSGGGGGYGGGGCACACAGCACACACAGGGR